MTEMNKFTIPHPSTSKQISITFITPHPTTKKTTAKQQPQLIFTHGAGGDLSSPGSLNFMTGFATLAPIAGFDGPSNLPARTKQFSVTISHFQFPNCLGGRSMGARAAITAAVPGETKMLVLVSYPLKGPKGDLRDGLLLDLEEGVKVLFVSGEKDSMCDFKELERVRREIKADSWMVRVKSADHGMNVTPKSKERTEEVGKLTGKVAAEWVLGQIGESGEREGAIDWDEEGNVARWSGWGEGVIVGETEEKKAGTAAKKKTASSKKSRKADKKVEDKQTGGTKRRSAKKSSNLAGTSTKSSDSSHAKHVAPGKKSERKPAAKTRTKAATEENSEPKLPKSTKRKAKVDEPVEERATTTRKRRRI